MVSPSASVAVTVPIAVWFSAALKVADEVNTGASLILTTIISITWLVIVDVPSVASTTAVVEDPDCSKSKPVIRPEEVIDKEAESPLSIWSFW